MMKTTENKTTNLSKEAGYLKELYQEWSGRMAANPNMTLEDIEAFLTNGKNQRSSLKM